MTFFHQTLPALPRAPAEGVDIKRRMMSTPSTGYPGGIREGPEMSRRLIPHQSPAHPHPPAARKIPARRATAYRDISYLCRPPAPSGAGEELKYEET